MSQPHKVVKYPSPVIILGVSLAQAWEGMLHLLRRLQLREANYQQPHRVLALLLGCLKLTVPQAMCEYWKLSSLILQSEWYGSAPPLFDINKLEMVMDQIVRKYYPDGLPLKDPTGATKV